MHNEETYRPANIEFNTSSDLEFIPESLGTYETAEDANKFMHGNVTAIGQSLTVCRHMDNFEKKVIREKYCDIMR